MHYRCVCHYCVTDVVLGDRHLWQVSNGNRRPHSSISLGWGGETARGSPVSIFMGMETNSTAFAGDLWPSIPVGTQWNFLGVSYAANATVHTQMNEDSTSTWNAGGKGAEPVALCYCFASPYNCVCIACVSPTLLLWCQEAVRVHVCISMCLDVTLVTRRLTWFYSSCLSPAPA